MGVAQAPFSMPSKMCMLMGDKPPAALSWTGDLVPDTVRVPSLQKAPRGGGRKMEIHGIKQLQVWNIEITIWLFNIAMENHHF